MKFLFKKLNTHFSIKKKIIFIPHDPAILFLGVYHKETKTLIQKDTCTTMLKAALFTIANMKAT